MELQLKDETLFEHIYYKVERMNNIIIAFMNKIYSKLKKHEKFLKNLIF